MGTAANHLPFFKHHDLVGVENRRNALRHHDHRFARSILRQGAAQLGVGRVIERRKAVIKQQHTGIGSQGARN